MALTPGKPMKRARGDSQSEWDEPILLGDRIAAWIKRRLRVKPCGACKRRQAWLNWLTSFR